MVQSGEGFLYVFIRTYSLLNVFHAEKDIHT